jgi:transposase
MRIIGLDIHRAFAEAVAWKDDKLSRLARAIMRREPLEEFAEQLFSSDIVVIEARTCLGLAMTGTDGGVEGGGE